MATAVSTSSTTDYAHVFTRLCHVVALRKKGQLADAIDNLVLATLYAEEPHAFESLDAIDQGIQIYFGLNFGPQAVGESFERLQSKQRIRRDPVTRVYALALEATEALKSATQHAEDLEKTVRSEWLLQLASLRPGLSDAEQQLMWRCLSNYMAKAFGRHGIETVRLLQPDVSGTEDTRTLSAYLHEAHQEVQPPCTEEELRGFVNAFFVTQTAARTRYISQLLDSTFTYFALSVDDATARYLRDSLESLSIFLDTNFIFGVLGLHDNPLADISKELVKLIKEHKFPFKLYYHAETLAELERTVFAIAQRLRSRKWTSALSSAASRTDGLSGVERQFHQLNARQATDPEAFISQYEHLVELLGEQGYTIFRPPPEKELEKVRRFELCGEYDEYIRARRPNNPKPYNSIDHDVAVLMTIQGLRRKGSSTLRAGAIFLSCDYTLHLFESRVLTKKGELGAVMLPNQLWQLLRPFVPTSDDFNKSFVEAFAMPSFRAASIEHSNTYSKVLTYLASYKSLSERTAVRVLSNGLLLDQLRNVNESDPQFQELIESSLAQDNEVLLEEREGLKKEKEALEVERSQERARISAELEAQHERFAELERDHAAAVQAAEQEKLAASLAQDHATLAARELSAASATELGRAKDATNAARATAERLAVELAAEKAHVADEVHRSEDLAKRHSRVKFILVLLVALIVSCAIVVLPSVFDWVWLDKHAHRLGLYAAAVFLTWSMAWAVFDSKRRGIALMVCVAPVAIAVITLLDK